MILDFATSPKFSYFNLNAFKQPVATLLHLF